MASVTICASVAFYPQVIEIAKELEKLRFEVFIPETANIMAQTGNFDEKSHKVWHQDPTQYPKKGKLMRLHFAKIEEGDAILVINHAKKGLEGYIGGNVLIEMALAWHLEKPIFLLNPIVKALPIAEEVYAMQPVVIHGNIQTMVHQLNHIQKDIR